MNPLFFDIETQPNLDLESLVEVDVADAPANYKDPAKIARWVNEKRASAIERMALDPDLAKIRSITWFYEGQYRILLTDVIGKEVVYSSKMPSFQVPVSVMSEGDMLSEFFNKLELLEDETPICGYNVIEFDFPMLFRRAMDLRVPIYGTSINKRYLKNGELEYTYDNTKPILDLYQKLGGKWGKAKSLKFYARKYGFPSDFGIDFEANLIGKDSLNLMGDEFVSYALTDVQYTVELYNRMLDYYV